MSGEGGGEKPEGGNETTRYEVPLARERVWETPDLRPQEGEDVARIENEKGEGG